MLEDKKNEPKFCCQKIIELEKIINELVKRVELLEERKEEYDRKFKFLW